MAKPRLVKVRALFYVLQHITKRGYAYFDTAPLAIILRIWGENYRLKTMQVSVGDYFQVRSNDSYSRSFTQNFVGKPLSLNFQLNLYESFSPL